MSRFFGLWLFGLSGCGKTYISKILNSKKKNSIIVDGDQVRKLVSFDLGYDIKSRETQILRMYGISKIIINSGFFPIISTVYFNSKLQRLCNKSKILPISSYDFFQNKIRPQFSSLDNSKFTKNFNFKIDNWKNSLNETMIKLFDI